MGLPRKTILRWFGMSFAMLLLAFSVRAQEESSSSKANQDEQQQNAYAELADANSDAASTANAPTPTPGYPLDGQIKELGTGLPWLGTTTPFRWGSFSLGSLEYDNVHDRLRPNNGLPASDLRLSILRTTFLFDRLIGKKRLVLQYVPQVAALNGQVRSNTGFNNSLSFGTIFELSPRLSVTVQDAFAQVHTRQLFPPDVLAADQLGGAVIQNNFLENPGRFIEELFSATVNYKISPRTLLTVSPMYRYARTTNNEANYLANGHTYEGSVTLTHAITPRRNIGIVQTGEVVRIVAPAKATARFYTTGLFYGEQLSQTWWVTGRFGAEIVSYSNAPAASHWMAVGSVTLLKDFSRKAVLAMAVTRGETFNNYVTDRRGDRADVSLGYHLTSRLVWNNGVGYYREIGSDPRIHAKYGATALEYHLSSGLSLFAHFDHRFQASNAPDLLSGTRGTFVFGVRWEPPKVPVK